MENDSHLPRTKYQNAAFNHSKPGDSPAAYTGDFSFGESTDRRFAYFRQASLRQNASVEPHTPQHELTRSVSSIDIPPGSYFTDFRFSNSKETGDRISAFSLVSLILGGLRSGNKQMRRLFVLISLNVAYSTAELFIGLFSGRIGLVSDAFHLTFGCGLLSFSLFAMAASRQNPDRAYSYGAGLILASWLLSLGVANAEVLCLGLVSVAVFMLVMPLFKATGGILLQMAPPSIPSSALSKCWRQVSSREDIAEVSQARFWELVPGHVVGSISLQVKEGTDDRSILQFVHGMYHELGVQDLTVQSDFA